MTHTTASAAASNQTAEKLLAVLETLACRKQPVKLGEFAREMNMNASTLYRFIAALENAGYVIHYDDGRYGMSLKLCMLAEAIKQQSDTVELLHPYAVQASALFRESAHLARREGSTLVYVDNVTDSSQTLTIQQHIGKTAPLHCTGIGKLFLSQMSDAELDGYVVRNGLPRFTQYTCTTREALQREFRFFAENGYLYDNEECELGIRCVAVPVRDYSGAIVAGLSVTGPVARLTDDVVHAHLAALLEISREASLRLGLPAERA